MSKLTEETVKNKVADRVLSMRSSAVRDLFAAANRDDIISLAGGMPDVSLLPAEAVQKAAEAAYDTNRKEALQYGGTPGRPETAKVFSMIMETGGVPGVDPADILITTGAQEALDLLGKTFINPGDVILCEGPTYLGALQAFAAYQPEIICIPFDEDGMKMDLLEEELQKHGKGGVKFLYTIPNFQNPGGVTLSLERRKRLLELSEEYDFMVLEDDPYGRLRYEGEPITPLKALFDQVIYLGTISKTFAPGLRTGWIAAPSAVIEKVNLMKQGTDLCGSTFDQVIVEHYFTDTPWEETLAKFVDTYAERKDAMLAALEEFMPEDVTWTHPTGGFFVWLTAPENVDLVALLPQALEQGVIYTPGNGFFPDGETGKNCARLAFCFESPENLRAAIERMAKVIEDSRA